MLAARDEAAQVHLLPQPLLLLPNLLPPQLSLNRLTVAADGCMQVEAVGSPDRLGVAFGCTYPPSPKRTPLLGSGERVSSSGAATGGSNAGSRPATAAGDAVRHSSGSSLLAAALRLQGLGGRSVGLRSSGAARPGA